MGQLVKVGKIDIKIKENTQPIKHVKRIIRLPLRGIYVIEKIAIRLINASILNIRC